MEKWTKMRMTKTKKNKRKLMRMMEFHQMRKKTKKINILSSGKPLERISSWESLKTQATEANLLNY